MVKDTKADLYSSKNLDLQSAYPARYQPLFDPSRIKGFVAGGLGACCAVTFTNPLEVIKTRFQLQGELISQKVEFKRVYTSLPQAFKIIYQHEGILGLQRGLKAAYGYQILMNSARFGGYDLIKNNLPQSLKESFVAGALAGAASGAIGATLGSPLFLIKTRLQAQCGASMPVIGTQYPYKNAIDGLRAVWRTDGFAGLYRGTSVAALRTAVGSGVQLPLYDITKRTLLASGHFSDTTSTHFLTSLIAGFGVCCAMNPLDVITTRMYSQPSDAFGRPLLYPNLVSCFTATVRSEGFSGFTKGFVAHYYRIGPHTCLTFIFVEQFRKLMS
ncbi:Mitochondrial oxaloacetate carrier protein, variant 2 [Entomophthora muscae]|uniref:Mitochondrial oxaloacetate carrier protein, variant 2 n=2 Tax=Entomophthora muscae TaxID=34485 RepID=A0ACC2SPV0_9FUNG|nr:Mitochondrial oxaloacetate carrier protein, variant 2 [Entomophthora muscae]